MRVHDSCGRIHLCTSTPLHSQRVKYYHNASLGRDSHI